MTFLSDAERAIVDLVQCPACRMKAGKPCVSNAGSTFERAPHPDRIALAKKHRAERAKLKTWTKP